MRIKDLHGRMILDSRGNPTLEVELVTNTSVGLAKVPSGASTGIHEALELRDNLKDYNGKGVNKALLNIKKIKESLKGYMIDDQRLIDETMLHLDKTKNKSNLGANTMLGISMAATRAGADAHHVHLFQYIGALYDNKDYRLPVPFANILNGGVHSGNKLMFQEFMIAPIKAKSFSEATLMVSETYFELKKLLEKKYGKESTSVGDEGGFAPPIEKPEDALDLIKQALKNLKYSKKVAIAMDPAASEFYSNGKYEYIKGKRISGKELADYYVKLTKNYNIVSIEDPFDQDDVESWKYLTKKLKNKKVQIVGDDLTVTNTERIKWAQEEKLCNALLLKINQIGTITESLEAAHEAQKNHWKVMVSHRSGETEDPYIADLAVGIGCGQIKLGAPARGERTAKYNQLLRIEDYLKGKAKYARW